MRTSSYEQIVIDILKYNGIDFVREKTFPHLGGARAPYRFDFYIPSMNATLEVQGEQHHQWVKKFHKERKDFLKAQERDRKKIAYCLAHGILIYEIPYWDLQKLGSAHVDANSALFKPEYLAKSKWHNDNARRKAAKGN